MNQEEQSKKMGRLIAKCWADESLKKKLLADPMATLKAEGVELPASLSIVAVENTEQVFHLVIPVKPSDLSDEDLGKVAGGRSGWMGCFWQDNRCDDGAFFYDGSRRCPHDGSRRR